MMIDIILWLMDSISFWLRSLCMSAPPWNYSIVLSLQQPIGLAGTHPSSWNFILQACSNIHFPNCWLSHWVCIFFLMPRDLWNTVLLKHPELIAMWAHEWWVNKFPEPALPNRNFCTDRGRQSCCSMLPLCLQASGGRDRYWETLLGKGCSMMDYKWSSPKHSRLYNKTSDRLAL